MPIQFKKQITLKTLHQPFLLVYCFSNPAYDVIVCFTYLHTEPPEEQKIS